MSPLSRGRALLATALVTLVLVATLLVARGAAPQRQEATLYVFGTLVEITLEGTSKAEADAAVGELAQTFQRMHREWHAWRPEGELFRINQAIALGERIPVSPFVRPLIEQAQAFQAMSGGLFDPAIGRLIGLWGFHADELPEGRLPDPADIEYLVNANPSMDDLTLDGDQLTSTNPLVRLDFGGFAKGVALDRAIDILRARGVPAAIVNAGGDLNTLGQPAGRPWSMGILDPTHWGVIAKVTLEADEVLYTSGNYRRFRIDEGIRRGHIIDPRDGWPVDHIVSASVLHTNGALADAAATALSVAGPEGWVKVAHDMNTPMVLLVDANGAIYTTPAMLERTTLTEDPPHLTVIDPMGP
ncbi:FAD:protein FMN transferase [Roseospirillum parvum]|uniref:FAD:protein FMN transferase n=1 Tax=Roseospirillum parvum TaxID=83401 RepID=A0A1G7WMR6_9PROT|nr:FAD:protein FMN transferase [Roseospirillum parvum]SDG73194.1 thiamine biosynthesis lipoprotein [Roseospirillum parvum]